MAMVVVDDSCLKQADSQSKSCGLVWGSAAAWRCSTFTRWTEWTLAMTWSWWPHYKYRPGYYYYYWHVAEPECNVSANGHYCPHQLSRSSVLLAVICSRCKCNFTYSSERCHVLPLCVFRSLSVCLSVCQPSKSNGCGGNLMKYYFDEWGMRLWKSTLFDFSFLKFLDPA